MAKKKTTPSSAAPVPPWEPSPEAILIQPVAAGIAYAIQVDGRCLARDYFQKLDLTDRNKFIVLFGVMVQMNMIKNPAKFRQNIGHQSCALRGRSVKISLAEFKVHGRRILAYQRGRWWLLISGFNKGANLQVETNKASILACDHLNATS